MLERERATFVGHSLGGGVVMQVAYQFPGLCERLVLVPSGGLGKEVHGALRAASLPGSELVLPLIADRRVRDAGLALSRAISRSGWQPDRDVVEFGRGYASLSDRAARQAFMHTLPGVIDPRGQRVSARDRLYLASEVPTLFVWGGRDRIIPPEHGHQAHAEVPGSWLEILPEAGHFPHLDEPEGFVSILSDFVETTEAAELDVDKVRHRLKAGADDSAPGG